MCHLAVKRLQLPEALDCLGFLVFIVLYNGKLVLEDSCKQLPDLLEHLWRELTRLFAFSVRINLPKSGFAFNNVLQL